jgi:protein SCO1
MMRPLLLAEPRIVLRIALSVMLFLALLIGAKAVPAGPFVTTPGPQTVFAQQPGARLPLQTVYTDDSGKTVALADFFGKQAVVLVLGYYRCPNLCTTLMDGVLESLGATGLPGQAFRVLGVSIDASETADIAARKKATYEPLLVRAGARLNLLTGRQDQITVLIRSVGFETAFDPALKQFSHPAGFLIATPDGRISRYFSGVRFDPREVRLALVEASAGDIGSASDRLWLLCSHFDPATGRYSMAAMAVVRAVCLLVLAALAAWVWRRLARQGESP